MPNDNYANEPNQSRSEDIIQSILDNTEYDEEARSRIEYLLIELKNAIEGGGGGGGVTSYSSLTEKPKIDNHTLQAGNNASSDLGLQTKLTFDSAPTENSTNPVTSGGVYTALDGKQDTLTTGQLSAVNSGITSPDVEQITTNENNIVFVSQNGAANYVKVGTNSYTNYGITVTVSNGEITISGTANGTFSLYIGGKITGDIENDNKLTSKLPDVIAFTGAPNTDNNNRMIFALYNGSTWVYSGSTNNLYHDLTDKVYTHWLLYIPIISGNQYNGVWKPMIVPKSLYDSGFTAYQPYAMSNAELTAKEKANENNILSIPRTTLNRLPYTITANATGNLVEYAIYGNSGGVGVATDNMFNPTTLANDYTIGSDGYPATYAQGGRIATITPIDVSTVDSVTLRYTSAVTSTLWIYSLFNGDTLVRRESSKQSNYSIDVSDGDTLYICFYSLNQNVTTSDVTNIMLSEISKPYEPYGKYMIPVTVGNTTTNLYVDSPLTTGEIMTSTDFNTNIAISSGSNAISSSLTNKPIMYCKYV